MHARKLRPTDIAAAAGVSRAAVSKWMHTGTQTGWVNVETSTLRRLAESLHMQPTYFLEEQESLAPQATRFLWDRLYPTMESLLDAVSRHQPVALARVVQVLGFRDAKAIVGDVILHAFPTYQQYIYPSRRRELELLWALYQSKR